MAIIYPMPGKVIVKRNAPEAVSAGGILIAGATEEKANIGQIKFLPSQNAVFSSLEVGNIVCFPHYKGHSSNLEGEELLALDYEDIIGVVE